MTAYVLVVGDPDWDDPPAVEAVCQKAYLTLRPDAGQVLWLTLDQPGPEQTARAWLTSHGMLLEPNRAYRNKYVLLNHLLRTVVPDLVLIFGSNNVTRAAAERSRLYGIRYTHIT